MSTNHKRFAYERSKDCAADAAFAGVSVARLHGIGDPWERHHDFIAPTRRQSQRSEIRYRQRTFDSRDVTSAEWLPVLTLEATIADLFNAEFDLRHFRNVPFVTPHRGTNRYYPPSRNPYSVCGPSWVCVAAIALDCFSASWNSPARVP